MTISPLFTDGGLNAVNTAQSQGLKARITHLAFGDHGWTPTSTASALVNERARLPLDVYEIPGSQSLQLVSILDENIPPFDIREVAVILEDGTLLAIWSDPTTPVSKKVANTDLTFTFTLTLAGLPEDSVEAVVVDGTGLDILSHLIQIGNVQMDILARQMAHDTGRVEDRARMTSIEDSVTAINLPNQLDARLLQLEHDLSALQLAVPTDRTTEIQSIQTQINGLSLPDNVDVLLAQLEQLQSNLGTAAYKDVGTEAGQIPERVANGGLVGQGSDNARPLFGSFWGYQSGDHLHVYVPTIGGSDYQAHRVVKAPPVEEIGTP